MVDRLMKRSLTSGRSDDNIETIRKRLHIYVNSTKPGKYSLDGPYAYFIESYFDIFCHHIHPSRKKSHYVICPV